MKKCSKCNNILSTNTFSKSKQTKDGFFSWCKICVSKYYKTTKWILYRKKYNYSIERKNYFKKYYLNNKDRINKSKINPKEYFANYRKKEIYKEYQKKYQNKYILKRLSFDINFKLRYVLRSRISGCMKRIKTKKGGSAVRDLGCSIDEFKIYIEAKFKNGMSWNNHGQWHIDHIKPLSKFDLTDREQFLEACHYTNLQPLWAIENLSKNNK